MATQVLGPRKRRTRQHVIADLSVHHLEGFILREGHTAQRIEGGYNYDLYMQTFDEQGFVEPGLVRFQLKASESLTAIGSNFVFDLDIRDYNLWMGELLPVILVLYDATRRRAYWLDMHRYFTELTARRPEQGAKQVRVYVPARQIVNRKAVAIIRTLKAKTRLRLYGEPS